ncbi:hypothetical protein EDB85DRAFT_1897638 [Lactarius pseudohatsudake]|nr:hypothetical protein EDB85DRAFT_1897638 [Lactarius pseudohatsudake]
MVGCTSVSSCLRSRPPRERLVYNILQQALLARHVERRASRSTEIVGFSGFTDADGVAAEHRWMWMICEAACNGTVVASIGTAQIVPTFSCVLGSEAITPPGKRHHGRLFLRLLGPLHDSGIVNQTCHLHSKIFGSQTVVIVGTHGVAVAVVIMVGSSSPSDFYDPRGGLVDSATTTLSSNKQGSETIDGMICDHDTDRGGSASGSVWEKEDGYGT